MKQVDKIKITIIYIKENQKNNHSSSIRICSSFISSI